MEEYQCLWCEAKASLILCYTLFCRVTRSITQLPSTQHCASYYLDRWPSSAEARVLGSGFGDNYLSDQTCQVRAHFPLVFNIVIVPASPHLLSASSRRGGRGSCHVERLIDGGWWPYRAGFSRTRSPPRSARLQLLSSLSFSPSPLRNAILSPIQVSVCSPGSSSTFI